MTVGVVVGDPQLHLLRPGWRLDRLLRQLNLGLLRQVWLLLL